MLTTSFANVKEHHACAAGYQKLARHLRGVREYGANTPIPLLTILESNGLMDALWCLRAVPPEQTHEARRIGSLLTADSAKRVLHIYERQYPGDPRVADCIEGVYKYWRGEIDLETLRKLRAAAHAAYAAYAAAAADAAYAAAYAAAAHAAYASEREWQAERFAQYLKGEA